MNFFKNVLSSAIGSIIGMLIAGIILIIIFVGALVGGITEALSEAESADVNINEDQANVLVFDLNTSIVERGGAEPFALDYSLWMLLHN